MPSRTRKSHRKSHRRSTKTHRRHRGGEINPYAFNYALFESMQNDFLSHTMVNMEFVDKKKFLAAIEKELRAQLMDKEFVEAIKGNDSNNNHNSNNNNNNNANDVNGRIWTYFYDEARDCIENITNLLSLGAFEKLSEREYSIVDMTTFLRDEVLDLVIEFVTKLPEANRKSQQNASNTYKVMSSALPPNVAATVASYRTGVEAKNNPAYMEGY